ncbi:MAG: hypothetical protein PUB87_06135 [Eubacteriaceae bacterium]|nr:hypothetical protein [Eubacteriaceae bacterium]
MEKIKTKRHNVKVIASSDQKNYISDSDAEMDARVVEAVRAAVSRAEVCNKPIAKYDVVEKKAYVEYPDGRRIDVR